MTYQPLFSLRKRGGGILSILKRGVKKPGYRKVPIKREKPQELMTKEERDEHYMKHFQMTYDEFMQWCEENKERNIGEHKNE